MFLKNKVIFENTVKARINNWNSYDTYFVSGLKRMTMTIKA